MKTIIESLRAARHIELLILIVLLAALASAQRISQERERRTLPALVNSPLSAASIADGKLLGAWTFDLWLATLTLPFLAVASLWGGLPFGRLLLAWGFNVGRIADCAAKNSDRVYLLWNPNFESPTGVLDPAACGLLKFQ